MPYSSVIVFLGTGDEASQRASQTNSDPHKLVHARIDIRKFAQFLAGQQVSPVKVICSKHGHVDIMYVNVYLTNAM